MASTTSSSASNATRATLMPQIDLPGGVCAFIIDKEVLDSFAAIAPPDQRYVVDAMKALIHNIRKDGSAIHLAKLGLLDPQKYHILQSVDIAKFKTDLLMEFHWKLVQYLRFTTPTRIEEAVPIIENFFTNSALKESFHRLLGFYGAVAYSRIIGKEEAAINLYKETSKQMIEGGSIAPILTYLWAKANVGRLARKMGDIKMAENEELYVRNWILNNPWIFSPDVIYKLIGDDLGTGANVLNHPEVLSLFSHLRQLASVGNYKPMMEPTNSNLDLAIVDNQTQTMTYDTELFSRDSRFRTL